MRKTIMQHFGVQPLFLDLQTSVILCRLRDDQDALNIELRLPMVVGLEPLL